MADEERARSRRMRGRYTEEMNEAVKEAAREFQSQVNATFRDIETRERKMRELMVNRQRTQDETVRAHIDALIQGHQDAVDEAMKTLRSGAASYWDDMSKAEKKAFMRRLKQVQEVQDSTEDAIKRIHSDFDDMLGDMDKSFSETMDSWAESMREWGDSFNLSAIQNAMQDTVDSYVQNLREMRSKTGSWFDEKGFNQATKSMVDELSSYSFNAASEYVSSMMKSLSIKSVEEAALYANKMAAASKVWDLAVDDMQNFIWRDAEGNGELMSLVSNIASSMEDNQELYVDGAEMMRKMNEAMGYVAIFSAKDDKRQKKLLKSVTALEALRESEATEGMDQMIDMMSNWQKMTGYELQSDEQFQQIVSRFTGLNGWDARAMFDAGQGAELVEMIIAGIDRQVGDSDIAKKQVADSMGLAYTYQLDELLNTWKEGTLHDEIVSANQSAEDAFVATDNGESLIVDKENETVGALQEFKNDVSNLLSPITNFFAAADISMGDIADVLVIGSSILKGVGGISKLFGGDGISLGGLLSKIPGVGKIFGGAGGAGAGGGLGGGLGGGGLGGGAGGGGILSGLQSAVSGLTSAGGLFEGASATSWGVGAGSTVLSIAAPVAGGFMALNDAIEGAGKAEEWLGKDDGNTASGKVASVLGGAIGGTEGGLKGALGGAAKGALIGAVAGPVGAAVGGLIGAAAGALGGEKIAKAIKGTWDFAKDMAGKAWNFAKDTAKKVWDNTKKFAKAAWDTAKNVAKDVWNGISTVASSIWNGLQEGAQAFAEAGATLLAAGGEFAEGVGKGIGAAAEGIGQGTSVVIEGFGNAAESMFNGWFGGISDVLSGFGDTLAGFGKGVGDTVRGGGDAAASVINSLTGGKGVGGMAGDFLGGINDALFGKSKTEVDLSSVLANATGDPVLDRMDIMIAYLKVVAENGGTGGGGKEDKGLVGNALDTVKDAGSAIYEGGRTLVTDLYEGGKKVVSDIGKGASAAASWVGDRISDVGDFLGGLLPFAEGTSYVSNDGAAFLHKGEAVLTADQVEAVREPADGGLDIIGMVKGWFSKFKPEIPAEDKPRPMVLDALEAAMREEEGSYPSQLSEILDTWRNGNLREPADGGLGTSNWLTNLKTAFKDVADTFIPEPVKDAIDTIRETLGTMFETDLVTTEEDQENEKELLKEFKKNGIFGKFMSNLKSGSFSKTLMKGIFGSSNNSKLNQTMKNFFGGSSSGGGLWNTITSGAASLFGFGGGTTSRGGGFGGGRTSGGSGGSAGSGAKTFSSDATELAAWISEMTSSHEGTYGSINYNDNGAVSIGRMQWHGGNAKNLLNAIKDADPNTFNALIQQYGAQGLADSLASDDNWKTHIVDKGSAEASAIKAILESTQGQAIQEQWRRSYAQNYIDKAKSLGLTDMKAIAYIADMYNQYGMYSDLINKSIIPQALQMGGTLGAVYQATKNNTGNYLTRRGQIYDELINADLSGITSYDVGTPWVPEDQVALIHEGEAVVPAEANPLNEPLPAFEGTAGGDNDDVVEALQWTVSRLEAKLDKLISVVSSGGRRQVHKPEEVQRVFAPVKSI